MCWNVCDCVCLSVCVCLKVGIYVLYTTCIILKSMYDFFPWISMLVFASHSVFFFDATRYFLPGDSKESLN